MEKRKIDPIKLGAIISYIALGVNIITGLIYTPWMVDKIGQSNYGLYTLATSLIAIFMLDFGLGSAVSRFVSKYRAEGNTEAINNIVGIIYKLYFIIDIVIAIVLVVVYFFIDLIYVKLTPAEIEQFKTLYLIVAGFNIISFPFSPLNGILNAFEKFIPLKLCDLVSKILTVAFVVIALNFSSNVALVVFANAASNIVIIFIKLITVKTAVPIKVNFRASGSSLYKTLFSFTMWTTIISIMQRFTHSFAPSVLGMTASSIEIAIYAPAVTLEGYFYLFATAVNGLFLPKVSRYIADKKEENILQLMIKVGKYQIVFLGMIFVGFVSLGQEFMTLWMGPEYARTYYCAIIIFIPTLISATQQIANTTLIAKKLIKYQAICMIITGMTGLAISYVLSMYIGAMGVCVGTAITSIANMIYMNIVYKSKAQINVFEFYKKTYLRAIPCYAITIILGLIVSSLIEVSGWIGIIIKGIVVVSIFAVVFFVIYISNKEKKEIFSKIKSKLKKG
ncbi:MAG: oligosaccharide flippase family protein [Clostridia bacterium]|nr:oligosaccharide flippase family protein [Clostridia bacterium]